MVKYLQRVPICMYLIPGAICIREDRGVIREDHKNCLFDKREISSDKPSACREKMGNVFVKRGVMVKAGLPPSISEETVCKVAQKTDLKWTHFQRNRILIREEMGNVFVKRGVMVKAGIPPSISEETVCKVVQKTDLQWSHFQRNRILIREEMGNVFVKRGVMVKAGIPPSIREETVCKVVQKTDLQWSHFEGESNPHQK